MSEKHARVRDKARQDRHWLGRQQTGARPSNLNIASRGRGRAQKETNKMQKVTEEQKPIPIKFGAFLLGEKGPTAHHPTRCLNESEQVVLGRLVEVSEAQQTPIVFEAELHDQNVIQVGTTPFQEGAVADRDPVVEHLDPA